ncbi:MAG: hypothetical protein V4727_12615 [Verrucomicrobiota bacterium]
MKILSVSILSLFIMGCAKTTDPLIVKLQTVREQGMDKEDDPMARHERVRRFHGAVSMAERAQRLGQYYTILWQAEAGVKKEILFEYQQAKSGSKIKTMKRPLDVNAASGKEEFSVIGDNYFDNGRVLTWRISLIADGKTIATEQSYMWE